MFYDNNSEIGKLIGATLIDIWKGLSGAVDGGWGYIRSFSYLYLLTLQRFLECGKGLRALRPENGPQPK